jgi:hypothetical protein
MPALRCVVAGVALVLASALGSREARASDEARASGAWDASLRAGYAAAWTTGVSSLGAGAGASVGYVFPIRIRLELVAVWSAGDTDVASNAVLTYRASYSSLRGTAGAAYEIPIGPVRLRPGLQTGLTFIYGTTQVGAAKVRDGEPRFIVGPALAAVVRLGRFDVGLATEAFFLPSWVAAPSAGVYALTGARF